MSVLYLIAGPLPHHNHVGANEKSPHKPGSASLVQRYFPFNPTPTVNLDSSARTETKNCSCAPAFNRIGEFTPSWKYRRPVLYNPSSRTTTQDSLMAGGQPLPSRLSSGRFQQKVSNSIYLISSFPFYGFILAQSNYDP
jgi:hypothetical protein